MCSIRNNNRTGTLLFALLSTALVSACSSYMPPQSQHVYTTSTQGSHTLTGLEIIYRVDGVDSAGSTYAQAALLTPTMMKYFIDGRLIATTNHARPLRTFVQLPPGQHQLAVVEVAQGVLTLGMESAQMECLYAFSLASGQRGKFQHAIDVRRDGDFSDIDSWQQVGECK